MTTETPSPDLAPRVTEIVVAYVANNSVPASELPGLISTVHAALAGLGKPVVPAEARPQHTPAEIRKSIAHDHLVSFEDGKRYKTLKRHLRGVGLTPETYRAKHGLPDDYPMVAASYSEARSALAKGQGLGQVRRQAA